LEPASISIADTDLLTLLGRNDENLALLEKQFGVSLVVRGNDLLLSGSPEAVKNAHSPLTRLVDTIREESNVCQAEVVSLIRSATSTSTVSKNGDQGTDPVLIKTFTKTVRVRSTGQGRYVAAVAKNDIVFAIGPAGTGKTYLAVATAVAALRQKLVSRIVLARPAVEAGESLGFLPGAIEEKVDPYLRPLYDALQELLEPDRLRRFQDMKIVEVAPLAFMRGRTLNDAFIILDEAQNTTPQQMKMFLTRLGSQSKVVVTGDITQTDLPKAQPSGLVEVQKFLRDVEGLSFIYLNDQDVIRNPLVQVVVQAYERYEQSLADEATGTNGPS
jgi:phosphate starvation-inducible PhoH-like protein